MTSRFGLYLDSVMGTKVLPNEPVPPVIRIDELFNIYYKFVTTKNSYLNFYKIADSQRAQHFFVSRSRPEGVWPFLLVFWLIYKSS